MAEASPDSAVTKILGPPLGAAIGALIAGGGAASALSHALTTAVALLGGAVGLAFSVIYRRYVGVLGAGAKDRRSLERQAYDALRGSLAEGGGAARRYARWLRLFLDRVERFFGDAGMADRTLFPRAFGLRTSAPLWTAPAFDRCLLLALIYPIVTIFLTWAISGHIGPAEQALRLKPDAAGWQRAAAGLAFSVSVLAIGRQIRPGWGGYLWFGAAFFGAVAVSIAGADAVGGAVGAAMYLVRLGGAGATGVILAIVMSIFGPLYVFAPLSAVVVAVLVALVSDPK